MKQEWSVLDIESHRKVCGLRDGGLEVKVADIAPWTTL